MQSDEMRLDGNAAAGTLRELFARDMTAALATCAGCGAVRAVGALLDYGGAMGLVLRCPQCDKPMLRMARAHGCLRVDISGMSFIAIDDAAVA